jgi:hypothetical protein
MYYVCLVITATQGGLVALQIIPSNYVGLGGEKESAHHSIWNAMKHRDALQAEAKNNTYVIVHQAV